VTHTVTQAIYNVAINKKGFSMATMGFIQESENIAIKANHSLIVPETFTHSIAFGETGCGKTSSFIYPNLIKRLELGHGILVYDYKGKEHLSVKVMAEKYGRLTDVVEIGKPWGESINLIEKMDEDELDKFFDNILKHSDDNKYWQNSAKSLGQSLLKVLKSIDNFATILAVLEEQRREYIEVDSLMTSFKYPTKRNLESLIFVASTFEVLGNFIKSLSDLPSTIDELIEESLVQNLSKGQSAHSLKPKYIQLVSAKHQLMETIQESKSALKSFGEDSNENLTQNIMGSLTSPLLSLSQNTHFNTNDFDIVEALNEGKILIINVESLSNAVVETLNNSILYELSKRTNNVDIHPVSIFIDEVQRVVSKNTDLPIDIFREAKVDMFLATQNSSLLKDKLKEEKFDSLMGNLTRKYYFKSSHEEDIDADTELYTLKTFEYLSSENQYEKVVKSRAIFIKDELKLKVEFIYQKSLNILEQYLYKLRGQSIVLKYDSRLYKDNKIVAIDINTKKETVHDSFNKAKILHLQSEVNSLFVSLKEKEFYVA